MSRVVDGSIVEAVLTPWVARSDHGSEPRYQLACSDEPSMRNLIRSELLPRVMCWDTNTRERLRLALALALQAEHWPRRSLEAEYTPVASLQYEERYFWLWVWDELFHQDLPGSDELVGYELDWSPTGRPETNMDPGAVQGEWLEIFEARKHVRFGLPGR